MEKTAIARKTSEPCLICEEKKEVGIHICDQFICESCERKLVHTDTRDASYGYFIRKLRSLSGDEEN